MKKHIATIRKNAAEEVRVSLDEYKGHNLVSLRVWTDPYAGDERIPTKKGVSMSAKLLPELREALEQAEAQARAAGLLGDDAEA